MKTPKEPGKDLVIGTSNASNGKVPALKQHRNLVAGFKALTDQFDKQIKIFEELQAAWQKRGHSIDISHEGNSVRYAKLLLKLTREGAEQCAANMQQQFAVALETEDLHHPSDEYLMTRIASMGLLMPGMMVTKDYGTRLAEILGSEEPSLMVSESIFHELENTWTKSNPPGVSDVLSLLKKHKPIWQRRLDAIDLKQIQRLGEQTIFALQHKHAIFEDAVMEYLSNHGYDDLAARVHDDDGDDGLSPYDAACEGVARNAEILEWDNEERSGGILDWDGETMGYENYPDFAFCKARIEREWDVLMLNAQRRANQDKKFVCTKCAAGYDDYKGFCIVCGSYSNIVGHELWDEKIATEQQTKQLPLLLEKKRRKLLECQRQRSVEDLPFDVALYDTTSVRKALKRRRWHEEFVRRDEEYLAEVYARSAEIENALWVTFERVQAEEYHRSAEIENAIWDAFVGRAHADNEYLDNEEEDMPPTVDGHEHEIHDLWDTSETHDNEIGDLRERVKELEQEIIDLRGDMLYRE